MAQDFKLKNSMKKKIAKAETCNRERKADLFVKMHFPCLQRIRMHFSLVYIQGIKMHFSLVYKELECIFSLVYKELECIFP